MNQEKAITTTETKQLGTIVSIKEFEPSLKKGEKEIVKAYNSPTVEFADKNKLGEVIFTSLNEAQTIVGSVKLSGEELNIMTQVIFKRIMDKHPFIRCSEIPLAIRNGAFGEYKKKETDVVFVSAQNVIEWVQEYQERKNAVLKKQIEFNEKKKHEEMEQKKYAESVKKYWRELGGRVAEYKGNGETSDMFSIWFENLVELKVIQLSKDDYNRIFKKAMELENAEMRARRVNIHKIGNLIEVGARKRARIMALREWLDDMADTVKPNIIKNMIDDAVKECKPETLK